jgi:hypothetical protein
MNNDYCLCYYAKQYAIGIAWNLLSFGCETFFSATHINKINDVEAFVNHPDFNKEEFIKKNIGKFFFDNLLDAIKISICFENYMKAKLLLNAYVIHTIKECEEFKILKKAQKDRPIRLNEVIEIETWEKIDGQEIYYLPGLTKKTIQFNTMLNRDEYQKVIGLPPNIKNIISKLNDERNTLHFLTGMSGEYGNGRLKELRQIIKFVETDLVVLQNQLVDDLKLSEDKKIKISPTYL